MYMTDTLLSPALIAQIKEDIMHTEPIKIPWDSQESLSDQQVNMVLALPDGLEQVENELRSFHAGYFRDMQHDAIRHVLQQYKPVIAREWGRGEMDITDRDLDDIVKQYDLIKHLPNLVLDMAAITKHTTPRVVLQLGLYQSYAGLGWPWAIEYEDVRDILHLFNINPRKILPHFPDFPRRNGREYVDPRALKHLWESGPLEGQYVAPLKFDLWDYHLQRDHFHTGIVLHKGTEIWLHDYFYGVCSARCIPLLKDLKIQKQNLTYHFGDDNKTIGNGLTEACAFTQEYWSGKISPVLTKFPARQSFRPLGKLLRLFRYGPHISTFQVSTIIAAFNDLSADKDSEVPQPGEKMERDLKSALWRQFPIEGRRYLREQADKNAEHLAFRISEPIGQVRIPHCQFLVHDARKEVVWKEVQSSARSAMIFERLAAYIWTLRDPE